MTPNHTGMFAKAKEIQRDWKPEVGDRYWDCANKQIRTYIKFSAVCKDCIFLPSIEWLAERWHEVMKGYPWEFICSLHHFTTTNLISKYERLGWNENIIILAFYMSELHSKRWDEKKGWV